MPHTAHRVCGTNGSIPRPLGLFLVRHGRRRDAGVLDQGTVRTTPGAPVFNSSIHPSQSMTIARFNTKQINDPWSEPYDFFSPHPGTINVLFADGSVRPVAFSTPMPVLRALATRHGGEAESLPD